MILFDALIPTVQAKLKTMDRLRRTYKRLLYKYATGRLVIPMTSTTIQLNCGGRSWSRCQLATFFCLTLLVAFCTIEYVLRFEPPDDIKPAPAYDEQPLSPVDPPPTHTGLYRCIRANGIGESHLVSVDPDCEVGTFVRESTHGCIGRSPTKRSKEMYRCVTGGRTKWTHSVTTSGCKEGAFREKLLGYVQAKKTSDGGDWVQLLHCQVKDADLVASLSAAGIYEDPDSEFFYHNRSWM